MSEPTEYRPDQPVSLVWPVLLIGLGVIFLLSNLGLLPAGAWGLLARLWPLGLILVGLDLILGRRSRAGALIVAALALALVAGAILLLVVSPRFPGLNRLSAESLQSRTIQAPLGGVSIAEVRIDWSSGENRLSAAPESSGDLVEGQVSYYGELLFRAEEQGERATVELGARQVGLAVNVGEQEPVWTVALHPAVRYSLFLDTGSGQNEFDLSTLELESVSLDSGSGSVNLRLPEGPYRADLETGSGAVSLMLPAGAPARVELEGGSGRFTPGPALRQVSGDEDRGVWETAEYSGTDDGILIEINQGSGDVEISGR